METRNAPLTCRLVEKVHVRADVRIVVKLTHRGSAPTKTAAGEVLDDKILRALCGSIFLEFAT